MTKHLCIASALAVIGLTSPVALAQGVEMHAGVEVSAGGGPQEYAYAPVPPHVEEAPVAVNQGAFCYAGPHPVDTRVAAGTPWDETQGNHTHFYAPFDLRLFAFKDGCYHFIGDPRDFGYRGQVHSYYGAHPITDVHGGGWCFMIGGHGHWWRPWSPFFVTMGPWYYWQGPYDHYFHSYWPYYAVYYRSHYPRYYRGGRFHRGREGGWAVAPPVGRVTAPAQAMPASAGGGMAMGGAAPARAGGSARYGTAGPAWGVTQAAPATGTSPAWGAQRVAPSGGWGTMRTAPAQPAPAPSAAPAWGSTMRPGQSGSGWGTQMRPAPSYSAPAAPAPRWGTSGGSRFSAPSGGSGGWGTMRSAPAQSAPSFRSAPSSSGGGMRFAPSSSSGRSSGGFSGAIRQR